MFLRRAIPALLLSFISSVFPATVAKKAPPAAKVRAAVPSRASSVEKQWTQRWMRGMSVRDLAAQLVVISSYGELPSPRSQTYREYVHLVRDVHVGGITFVNRVVNGTVRTVEPYAVAAFLNRMQKFAKIPLLVSADFERGASMRVSNTTRFPQAMAYGAAHDLNLTKYLGTATAREARALGVHWVFAPDADVNNNPDNPIINTRSFGENPEDVSAQVRAFIDGAHSDPQNRVLATAKHFPGHGDTSTDSHMGLPVITVDRARMDQIELIPFKGAIAAGVDSIMTAHISVPAVDSTGVPATISKPILTGILRQDLGYTGIVVTDAMDMQGLAKDYSSGEAAIRALEAGVDVLLMPNHPEEVVRAIAAAVQSKRLTRKRLEESVARVLAAKARVGLQKAKFVDPDDVSDILEGPDNAEEAQQAQLAADRAVTLLKNDKQAVPMSTSANTCIYVLTENRYSQQGRRMLDEIRHRSTTAKTFILDPLMTEQELEGISQRADGCASNVVAAFVSVNAYKGNVALPGNFSGFVTSLISRKPSVTMVALGSPYLLRAFPNVTAYFATFSTVPDSEAAAVKAIFGEIPISGRMPVSIPGLAKVGDGIQLGK